MTAHKLHTTYRKGPIAHTCHPSVMDSRRCMTYSLGYNTAYEGDLERLGYNSCERQKRREDQQREGTRRTDEDAEVGKATPAMV